jgi:hypothetical protein
MVLRVVDSVPGRSLRTQELEFPAARLTLAELLRERVNREVEAFNRNRSDVYQGLVQPEESERLLNGYRLKEAKTLDAEKEYQRAVRAFGANGFVVLAGGKQLETLDDEIDLDAAAEIEFIKLVPLVGG